MRGTPTLTAVGATYLHTDALGSPVAEANQSGAVTKRMRYESYGAPSDGVYSHGPGYTGHVMDAKTGLVYMQQRYHDPVAGRLLSVDPVMASPGTFNRYVYANNNPYGNIDPDGRAACGKDTTCRLEKGERGGLTARGYSAHNTASVGFGRQKMLRQKKYRR